MELIVIVVICFDVEYTSYNGRLQLSMKFSYHIMSSESHVLHDLVPPSSFRSELLAFPFRRMTRHAKDFLLLSTCINRNV